jgi:hypothetical protein
MLLQQVDHAFGGVAGLEIDTGPDDTQLPPKFRARPPTAAANSKRYIYPPRAPTRMQLKGCNT